MAKEMTPQEYGKEFEKDLRKIFLELRKKYPIYFKRFSDSYEAGTYISEQPCDFIFSANGVSFFIECKSSLKHNSLKSCLSNALSDNQAKELWLWNRAGNPSLVLFKTPDGMYEVWDGARCAQTYRKPGARLRTDEREYLFTDLEHLETFFKRLAERRFSGWPL